MAADENRETPDAAERGGEKMSEDEIDRNLMESFPASDPPSWTLGTDHEGESTETEQPARNEST